MIQEHDRVMLTMDVSEYGLKAGDVGVVVMIHDEGAGYELEVFMADGNTLDVITVEAYQVWHISNQEVLHAGLLETVTYSQVFPQKLPRV